MRRFCLYFSFLLAALVVAPNANAQGELNLNQTYRDVIQLDFPAGKTQIPLPEGKWEVLGLQEDQSSLVTRLWRVYLVRVENDTLLGHIYISINHDLPAGLGWGSSNFCERENIYYIEVKSNRDGDVDCWAASRVRIKFKNSWPEARKQMHNTLLARNVFIPRKMIRAVFVRTTEDNTLTLRYYFQPYVLKDISTRENLKTWAMHWKPKVDAGFLGELEVTKTKETFAPPEQTPKTGTSGEEEGDIERRIIRLLKLYDEGLITESEYIEKRNQILEGL